MPIQLFSESPLSNCVAALVECVAQQWMCVLIGPSASGKTAVVRTLAAICGSPLVELSLTSGTDTSDLLGGFEQVELPRKSQVRGDGGAGREPAGPPWSLRILASERLQQILF